MRPARVVGVAVVAACLALACGGRIPGRAFRPDRVAPPTLVVRASAESDVIEKAVAPWFRLDYHEWPILHFHGGIGYGVGAAPDGLRAELALGYPLFWRRTRLGGLWIADEDVDHRFRRDGWFSRARVPGLQFMTVEVGVTLRPYLFVTRGADGVETTEQESIGFPRLGVRWGWCWSAVSGRARGQGCGYAWAHALFFTHGQPDEPEPPVTVMVAWPEAEDRRTVRGVGAGGAVGIDLPLFLDAGLRLRLETAVLPTPVAGYFIAGLGWGFVF